MGKNAFKYNAFSSKPSQTISVLDFKHILNAPYALDEHLAADVMIDAMIGGKKKEKSVL